MSRFARLRNHPVFASYFDAVHPLFWAVLVWQLLRAADRIEAHGGGDALISVYWWGGVEIEYFSDPPPKPSVCGSLVPTRKAWSDPIWASSVPAQLLAQAHPLFFPRTCGGSGRAQSALTKWASAITATPDTS